MKKSWRHQGMKKVWRPKASTREDGVDFISRMPDAILLLILSRLPSTEQQIRSSILSRRWRYLWTAIPSLDMRRRNLCLNEFKEFVYWVLASKTVQLDRFRLSSDLYNNSLKSSVWRWVHAAVMFNVKQIDLSFGYDWENIFELPHYLVSCGSLEVLKLDFSLGSINHDLILPKFVGFPALRVLHLTYVDLPEDDELVKDFLKSLPLLEDLSLIDCWIDKVICISCPKLKRLRINWKKSCFNCIKISCPELADLDLGGPILRFGGLFNGSSHFKPLWMHLYFSCESINAACNPALPNVKTLVLRTSLDAFTMDNFNRILKYCPTLENLKLIIRKDYYHENYMRLDKDETRRLLTLDVKRVEFFEFNGEKPKLVTELSEGELMKMLFTWGNKARFSN